MSSRSDCFDLRLSDGSVLGMVNIYRDIVTFRRRIDGGLTKWYMVRI